MQTKRKIVIMITQKYLEYCSWLHQIPDGETQAWVYLMESSSKYSPLKLEHGPSFIWVLEVSSSSLKSNWCVVITVTFMLLWTIGCDWICLKFCLVCIHLEHTTSISFVLLPTTSALQISGNNERFLAWCMGFSHWRCFIRILCNVSRISWLARKVLRSHSKILTVYTTNIKMT